MQRFNFSQFLEYCKWITNENQNLKLFDLSKACNISLESLCHIFLAILTLMMVGKESTLSLTNTPPLSLSLYLFLIHPHTRVLYLCEARNRGVTNTFLF